MPQTTTRMASNGPRFFAAVIACCCDARQCRSLCASGKAMKTQKKTTMVMMMMQKKKKKKCQSHFHQFHRHCVVPDDTREWSSHFVVYVWKAQFLILVCYHLTMHAYAHVCDSVSVSHHRSDAYDGDDDDDDVGVAAAVVVVVAVDWATATTRSYRF